MKPMVPGFLLTSSWEENPTDGGTQLTFWWKTAQGAVRTVFPQPAICFIDQRFYDKAQSIAVTLGWPVRVEKVALQSFDFEPACACYMPHEYVYRWRDVLAEQDIICREVDIRPTDRYLMERFIYGAAELHGSLQSADEDGAECRYSVCYGGSLTASTLLSVSEGVINRYRDVLSQAR